MNTYAAGAMAGLVATVVLSLIMMMKAAMGLMPELDVIAMLAGMMGGSEAIGWIAHFAIGVMWGLLFAAIAPTLPGDSHWVKGALFLLGPWLVMMVVLMPMAGAGLFGMNMGIMAPIMTLVLHLIFGAVMGATYAALINRGGAHAATM